jgi:hypothetical protein
MRTSQNTYLLGTSVNKLGKVPDYVTKGTMPR